MDIPFPLTAKNWNKYNEYMKLAEAIKRNPYDPRKGNESAYCRYLRYNVDGFYNKSIEEVKAHWRVYAIETALSEWFDSMLISGEKGGHLY